MIASAAMSGSSAKSVPSAIAASARCTATSCSRRRIHQFAGRGPRKVHTGVSSPDISTASTNRCARPLSQEMASAGSGGGLPPSTLRGSRGWSSRSCTICAAQRSPRPTCRNNCWRVQPGHVGTGRESSGQVVEKLRKGAILLDKCGRVVHRDHATRPRYAWSLTALAWTPRRGHPSMWSDGLHPATF